MLNVSEEVKDLYLTDNTPVEIKLTIGDDTYGSRDIVAGTVSITESICSLETFSLSAVEKNELTFSLFNENQTIRELVGKTVTATHVLTLDDDSKEYIPLGTYTIVDAVKDGDYIIACTCYDTMLAFDKIIDDWWNNRVQFPISIRDLVVSLFNEVGVQYTLPDTFTNDDFVVSDKPTFFENVAASEALSYIQEVVGGFFKADRLGVVRLLNARKLGAFGLRPKIGLYPKTGLYPAASDVVGFGENSDVQEYAYRHIFGDLTVAEYAVNKISALQIRGTENDVGVVVGTGTDAYIIEGNPLLFNITDATGREVAENIFNILKELVYVPFSGEFKALPFLEVGDCVYIVTYIGNIVKSPILNRVMNSQKLSVDSFITKGTKHRQIKRTINRMLSTINQKTHEVINTVDELSSTISNVEQRVTTNTTAIQQNATAINLTATRSGTFNLLTNSDFSDQTDHFIGWNKTEAVTNVEYSFDETFKGSRSDYNNIENGNCLTVSMHKYSDSVHWGYIWQEINYNGILDEAIQTQFTGRVTTWDGNAKFTMALRIWDDSGTSLYFQNCAFVTTSSVQNHTLFNFRNKWTNFLDDVADKTIGKIGIYIYVTGMTGENVIEVNHIFATFNSGDYLPWYSWTNYASKDLVSQINIAPSGVTIKGEKIDIKGMTTFSSDSDDTTTIDGGTVNLTNLNASNITSGTLSGNYISGGIINGIEIDSGDMYWYKGTTNQAQIAAGNQMVSGTRYYGVVMTGNLFSVKASSGAAAFTVNYDGSSSTQVGKVFVSSATSDLTYGNNIISANAYNAGISAPSHVVAVSSSALQVATDGLTGLRSVKWAQVNGTWVLALA